MSDNDPWCSYCKGRHIGQCVDGPEYDFRIGQYWWPLRVAITWQPCVVVRRTQSRESYGWKYEIIEQWPRASDLNYPSDHARYCKVAER